MNQQVLIENTSTNPISTTTTNQALDEVTKDNGATMSHNIKTQDMDIVRINVELDKYRKKITSSIINTLLLEKLLARA